MQAVHFHNYCLEGLITKLSLPKEESVHDFLKRISELTKLKDWVKPSKTEEVTLEAVLAELLYPSIKREDKKSLLTTKKGEFLIFLFYQEGQDYISIDIAKELPGILKDSPQYNEDLAEMKKILMAIVELTKLRLEDVSLDDEKITDRIRGLNEMYEEPPHIDKSKLEAGNYEKSITTKLVELEI